MKKDDSDDSEEDPEEEDSEEEEDEEEEVAHSQTSIVRLHRYLLDWDYVSQRRVCVYRLPGLCPTLDKHTQNNSNIYTSKTVITSVLNSSVASSMYSYLTVKCLQKLAPFLVKFALTHRKCSPEQV